MEEHYFSKKPSSSKKRGLLRCSLRGREFEFLTASGVFSYRRVDFGTVLLIEVMELPETGMALDLGCGYGAIGVVAARLRPGLNVFLTDINKRAVDLAKENVHRNELVNARVLWGDLFESVVGLKFDVVLSNPPFSAGFDKVVRPIVEGAAAHLKEGGSLQVVVRWGKGGRILTNLLREVFSDFKILARSGGYRVLNGIL